MYTVQEQEHENGTTVWKELTGQRTSLGPAIEISYNKTVIQISSKPMFSQSKNNNTKISSHLVHQTLNEWMKKFFIDQTQQHNYRSALNNSNNIHKFLSNFLSQNFSLSIQIPKLFKNV